jgi:hypothetical protein
MDVFKPLKPGLFFYECLRLLFLVFFLLLAPLEGGFYDGSRGIASGTYSVYMSSNALFPLMALFIWLKTDEYRNYLTLFISGKVIALASFYVWEIFSFHQFSQDGTTAKNIILLGGGALLSLADIFSVWAAWAIDKKYRRVQTPESGGF